LRPPDHISPTPYVEGTVNVTHDFVRTPAVDQRQLRARDALASHERRLTEVRGLMASVATSARQNNFKSTRSCAGRGGWFAETWKRLTFQSGKLVPAVRSGWLDSSLPSLRAAIRKFLCV
jgi:hypothetical protein